MQNETKTSTWNACCEYILKEAALRDDFVLVVPARNFDDGSLEGLPEERISRAHGSDANIVMHAAGLALAGKRPWIAADSSAFISRAYGAIREALAEPSLPVVIAVSGAGLSRGKDGSSSLIVEDTALMRAMPGMGVLVPSDGATAAGAAEIAAKSGSPVYLRCGLTETRNAGGADEPFHSGGARILFEGTDVTICACGLMTARALEASDMLEQPGISAEVIDCYSVKPFPEQILLSSVRRTGCCVTAEEGSCVGGLGGAAAECLGRTYPVPMRFVAVEDHFAGSGTPDELREYCGLTGREIVNAAAQVWALRRR